MKKLITLLALAFCLNAGAQIITTVCGNGAPGYTGDGGQATAAEMWSPQGVSFDMYGNMYIADNSKSCIRKVNTNGVIITIAGNGTGGYSGDGGQATLCSLFAPNSICFDQSGNLYFNDGNNERIRKINTLGIISTIAGNGTQGYSGDGGQATVAELKGPSGVCMDAIGNLYFADSYNERIRKISSTGVITTVAGNGTWGYSGDGGQASAAELANPFYICFDTYGNLYFSDNQNNCVRRINSLGVIETFAGIGASSGYSGDGGQATLAKLSGPTGICFDVLGNLYISDHNNNCVRMVNTSGIITTFAGNTTAGYGGDGGLANAAELYWPWALAQDAFGNLYITDDDNHRIRKVTNANTTALEKFTNSKEQVNIYPNPNNGSFVIETNNATKQTMQVYDVSGKLVLSQSINGKTTIDASSLAEGVYNISLTSNEGVVNKRLVIVR